MPCVPEWEANRPRARQLSSSQVIGAGRRTGDIDGWPAGRVHAENEKNVDLFFGILRIIRAATNDAVGRDA